MRQQRRISVGAPGGGPPHRQRRVSVTNKLGQTHVVSVVSADSAQYGQPNVRSRRSIVGGVRAPDGRRRSCVAVKGGGGIGGGGGALDAAELIRRREIQERAARGRRASLLAQARSGGCGQVAPFPQQPPPPKAPPAALNRKGSTQSTAEDSDEEDELILAAVAFMNGEAPPPVAPPPPQTKKSSVTKIEGKSPKRKNRLSVKHKKKSRAACKRLSEFSLMYDSDDQAEDDEEESQNDPPQASAADAYRLAMEKEQAALAKAHVAMMRQGGAPAAMPPGRTSLASRKEPPVRNSLAARKEPPKRASLAPTYEELEAEGIPAVQLAPECTVVSPELARHKARLEEAESRVQANMEGMTLEKHKKMLQEKYGGSGAGPGAGTGDGGKEGPLQKKQPPMQEPTPARQLGEEERPVSAELARHRARLEEAERKVQANMEGMTLEQHKKLLQEKYGKADDKEKEPSKPPPPSKEPPAPAQATKPATTMTAAGRRRAEMPLAASAPPSRRVERELNLEDLAEPAGAASAKSKHDSQHLSLSRMDSRDHAVRSVGDRWRGRADRVRTGERSNRWAKSVDAGGGGGGVVETARGTDDSANGDPRRDDDDAAGRALRAVVRARRSRKDEFDGGVLLRALDDDRGDGDEGGEKRRTGEDALEATADPLFEAIAVADDEVDEDQVLRGAMESRTPIRLSSPENPASSSTSRSSSSKNPAESASSSHLDDGDGDVEDAKPLKPAAELPLSAMAAAACASRRKSSLASLMDESTSSLLSWGQVASGLRRGSVAARRRMSDSASSLCVSIVSGSSANGGGGRARRRRSGGDEGSADPAGGWEHPLGWSDALSFIGGLGDEEWEKARYAARRRRRRDSELRDDDDDDDGGGGGAAKSADDIALRKGGGRRVRFPPERSQLEATRDVPHLIDYTDAERASTWRTRSDRESTRDDVLVAMMSLRNGDGIRCGRGLEALSSDEEWELRRINRDFVVAAVLEEQRAQGLLVGKGGGGGVTAAAADDEEEIAAASGARSALSAEAALEAAAADAEFVQERVRAALFDEEEAPAGGGSRQRRRGADRACGGMARSAPPASWAGGPFPCFGGRGGAGAGGGGMPGASAIPGLGMLTKHLSAEKCHDKLSDGNMICDFQRQGRQLFSKLRRAQSDRPHVSPSAA